ncbi:hypothetical protein SAMN06265360_10449 [Haloechinothrix alba]|uniref:Uncharacterized protein n=1 Tax=Haloechinothrix alba TaxID=664784 RepID=A0A238VVS3_9PSEU|nr:DUF5336 domain-containing protein [Haloechinothrix alba]SNR37589.1 hypothetical protein SAMN06265360_10449 [Haloechinothrix alba]
MTMPSSGFPAQGPQQAQQAYRPQPNPQAQGTQFLPSVPGHGSGGTGRPAPPLGLILALVVTALGVGSYFVSFADVVPASSPKVMFLLVGGLLAALHALPGGPRSLPFAALLSVTGFLLALSAMIDAASVAGPLVVLLIMALLQMAAAVVALLLEYGVLPPPSQQPAPPQPGQYVQPGSQSPYGQQMPPQQQTQQQPQHGAFGTPAPQGAQSPAHGYPQPGQFAGPAAGQQEQVPSPQPTQYAPHQGQFHQHSATQAQSGSEYAEGEQRAD